MLHFLFNPNGRVSRWGLWAGLLLPQFAATLLATVFDATTAVNDPMELAVLVADGGRLAPGPVTTAVWLFFLWPNIAVPVKRYHDRGMSGWWVLWFGLMVATGCAVAVFGVVGLVPDMQASFEAAQRGVQPSVAIGSGGLSMIGLGLLGAVGAALTQFVILCLLPGDSGANSFGPAPRDGGGRPEASADAGWADRLDPARLDAAASTVRAAAAPAAAPRAVRQPAWPTGAGPRASFGRRGA